MREPRPERPCELWDQMPLTRVSVVSMPRVGGVAMTRPCGLCCVWLVHPRRKCSTLLLRSASFLVVSSRIFAVLPARFPGHSPSALRDRVTSVPRKLDARADWLSACQ